MAVIHLKHHPELTAEKAMEIFKKGFAGKYEVYMAKSQLRDFTIKKSSMIAEEGVIVRMVNLLNINLAGADGCRTHRRH